MKYHHNILPEELEQIERYLLRRMTEEEAAAFTARIQTDENLSEKVEAVRLTIIGINEAAVSVRIQEYHKELTAHKGSEQKTKLFSLRWLLAASVLFIVATTTLWFMLSDNHNQKVYSSYYKPDPGLMTVMSSGNSNYTFEKAMVEYKNGQYSKALTAWTQLLREKPNNDTLLYFIGAALQATADYEGAIPYLQAIADDEQSSFQKDACWYLGLIYLQKGEKEKAAKHIRVSEHEKSEQVINVIRP